MIVSPPFEITGRVRPVALPREDLEITEGNLIVSGTANTETGEMNLTMQCKECIHGLLWHDLCPIFIQAARALWKMRKLIKATLIEF